MPWSNQGGGGPWGGGNNGGGGSPWGKRPSGGGGGGVMSARGAATAMSKLTWGLGIAFLACSLALTIISAQNSQNQSVTDLIATPGAEAPAAATPGLPDVSDMMPTQNTAPATDAAPSDAPAAPPRAE